MNNFTDLGYKLILIMALTFLLYCIQFSYIVLCFQLHLLNTVYIHYGMTTYRSIFILFYLCIFHSDS